MTLFDLFNQNAVADTELLKPISATPITTSTPDPIRNPVRMPGISSPWTDIVTA